MKFFILVNSLSNGGAERVASLWANGFARRGNEVFLILYSMKNVPYTYAVDNTIHIINIGGLLSKFCSKFLKLEIIRKRKLNVLVRKYHPDVIIGVMQPWAECAYDIAKKMGIPVVNTEHFSLEWPNIAPGRTRKHKEKIYEWNKKYDYVTVLTKKDKACLDSIIKNVTVLPNPLPFEPHIDFKVKDNIILAVGRLDGWYVKGFDLLIRAWAGIAPKYKDWKLQILGRYREKSLYLLNSIVEKYNLGNQVEFVGYQEDVLTYYQKASIFVLSSRYEGFGMVLLEAMSQGCACIACDYKGRQREIINGDNNGILCKTNDVEALQYSINELIENDGYREMLQMNAYERSKYFELDHIMSIWDGIINKINEKGIQSNSL